MIQPHSLHPLRNPPSHLTTPHFLNRSVIPFNTALAFCGGRGGNASPACCPCSTSPPTTPLCCGPCTPCPPYCGISMPWFGDALLAPGGAPYTGGASPLYMGGGSVHAPSCRCWYACCWCCAWYGFWGL